MRWSLAVAVMILAGGSAAAAEQSPYFQWDVWRSLPVQDGGRQKPLDTAAWDTLQTISHRRSIVDPKTGEKISAVAWYVMTLMESRAFDAPPPSATQPTSSHGKSASPHGKTAAPPAEAGDPPHATKGTAFGRARDRWDDAPLLRVGSPELQDLLQLPEGEKYLSPKALFNTKVRIPGAKSSAPFLAWTERLASRQSKTFSPIERKVMELGDAYWTYETHRGGKRVFLVPVQDSEQKDWLSLSDLVQISWDDTNDSTGMLRKAKEQFLLARKAFQAGSVAEFNDASAAFAAILRELGPQLGDYPGEQLISLEVGYNHWVPFRFAWIFMIATTLAVLLEMATRYRGLYVLGWTTFVAGLVAMIVGFWLRTLISGRAPVTNMYESVVYLALGTTVFGLLSELLNRQRYLMAAAAAISAVALILADSAPAVLDPHLRPLQPVLRDNFWLVTHVMTITLSYAAFALAMGIGDITLWFYLVGSKDKAAVATQSRFTYRVLQVGVLLLAVGTLLGAVWADAAWGRFWGWDPKEVWALISLVVYLAVLHARYIGWVGHLGLAAWSVVGFVCVIIAWYGVNYWLPGLHSYGGGGAAGGSEYVIAAIGLQLLYVLLAVLRGMTPRLK